MPTMCLIRLVNETHSPVTKKNREWQEKLPVVVLRAEEIMYSKANSEVTPEPVRALNLMCSECFYPLLCLDSFLFVYLG